MNCDKCNFPMVLDGDSPKSYHCPKCQTKAFEINGHIEWFDVDGNPFTPKPHNDSVIGDIEKELENIFKQKRKN